MDNEYISITEAVNISGKHITTIYTAIRKRKLKTIDAIENSKVIKKVLKSDLIRLFKLDIRKRYSDAIENSIENSNNAIENSNNATVNIQANSTENSNNTIANSIVTIENYKKAIEEVLEAKQSQLMKPLEEQALYRCGLLENEVKHLQAEKETIRQENELLREQVKILPDFQQKQETYKIQINLLEKEKEDLKTKTEIIQKEKEEQNKKIESLNQALLDNANNIKELATEKDKFQSILKEHEATVKEKERAIKDIEEIHQQELKKLEEEKKQIAEAWKKELEQAKRPWYKFW
ncbi:MAG: hypothetical protein ABRQ37_24155 [Candidatus Eremiobacterota bacterium]